MHTIGPILAATIMALALALAPTAHASPPTTLQPRGYDPYYRIPAATPTPPSPARQVANSTAHDPPTWWIAGSIAFTVATLTVIATHVGRIRARTVARSRE